MEGFNSIRKITDPELYEWFYSTIFFVLTCPVRRKCRHAPQTACVRWPESSRWASHRSPPTPDRNSSELNDNQDDSDSVGARSIARVRRNLVNCRGRISPHTEDAESYGFFKSSDLGRENDQKF